MTLHLMQLDPCDRWLHLRLTLMTILMSTALQYWPTVGDEAAHPYYTVCERTDVSTSRCEYISDNSFLGFIANESVVMDGDSLCESNYR